MSPGSKEFQTYLQESDLIIDQGRSQIIMQPDHQEFDIVDNEVDDGNSLDVKLKN